MTRDPLTFDSLLPSRTEPLDPCPTAANHYCAINCTSRLEPISRQGSGACEINCTKLTGLVGEFVRSSLALNTRLAYASDLAVYAAWGGSIPAPADQVAMFLAAHAQSHAPSTLSRYLAALSKVHRVRSLPDPTSSELVKATMRGIRRRNLKSNGSGPAKPLLRDDLLTVLEAMGNSPSDLRDRALLILGFAGALRRSELVALNLEDTSLYPNGMECKIRRSKTDPYGLGQPVWIASGNTPHCPKLALKEWITASGIKAGPLFRRLNANGRIAEMSLSGEAVSLILKRRLVAAGLSPIGFSGHSLRAGFVTSAALAGVPVWKIRMCTRHVSDQSVARYIRPNLLSRNFTIEALL